MKKLLGSILCATMLAATAPIQADAATELKFGHVLKEDSWYQQVAVKFKELVEERTKGDVTVTIFPNGQLGGEAKMIQSARVGAISLGVAASPIFEPTVPEFAVLSLPYLFDDAAQANSRLEGDAGQAMLDLLDSHGVVGLGFFSASERDVFGKTAIRSAADMKGLKIRVPQSPSFVDTYEAMGAQATPMAYTELYLALQNGVIDAADTSADVYVSDRFFEVSKYFNLTHVHYAAPVLFMSKIQLGRLSEENQQIVRQSGKDALAFGNAAYATMVADSIARMKQEGIEVVETDTTEMRDEALTVWPTLLESIPNGQAMLDRLQGKAQ